MGWGREFRGGDGGENFRFPTISSRFLPFSLALGVGAFRRPFLMSVPFCAVLSRRLGVVPGCRGMAATVLVSGLRVWVSTGFCQWGWGASAGFGGAGLAATPSGGWPFPLRVPQDERPAWLGTGKRGWGRRMSGQAGCHSATGAPPPKPSFRPPSRNPGWLGGGSLDSSAALGMTGRGVARPFVLRFSKGEWMGGGVRGGVVGWGWGGEGY